MKNKIRIVISGEIQSNTDGQWHHISALRLCQLYGFDPKECYLADNKRPETLYGLPKNLPIFRPRYDGKYKSTHSH